MAKNITSVDYASDKFIRVDLNVYVQPTTVVGVHAVNGNALYGDKAKLGDISENIHNQNESIVIGDLNSRVGNKNMDVVGRFGKEEINDNGYRLLDIFR